MTTTQTPSRRSVVRAMYAAQDCIDRLQRATPEQPARIPTDVLKRIAPVMEHESQWLNNRPSSAVVFMGDGEQHEAALAFLDNFIDDCRIRLRRG